MSENITISVIEYDISPLSDNLPGSYSHIGISWSDGRNFNFGAFKNGQYEAVGLPLDFTDTLGYTESPLNLPSRTAGSVSVSADVADIYYNSILEFASDLVSRNIGYSPTPNELSFQGNSNSGARFALSIIGIDATELTYTGNPFGVDVNLSDARFGLKPPSFYQTIAYIDYLDSLPPGNIPIPSPRPNDVFCFGTGTLISMACGERRPIELVKSGDLVMAFDPSADHGQSAPVPSKVVRLFRNHVPHMLDFHSTRVTPGHSYLCGDGQWAGKFRSLIDILREDGAVVKADGTLMRAATGCDVCSRGDAFVDLEILRIGSSKLTGEEIRHVVARGLVRVGTILTDEAGATYTLLDLLDSKGWLLQADGKIVQIPSGEPAPLRSLLPALPKPEDYILTRSGLTLADLYGAPKGSQPLTSSWPSRNTSAVPATVTGVLQASGLRADAVPASGGTPFAPGPSRKTRRKLEAEQRKRTGGNSNIGITMH